MPTLFVIAGCNGAGKSSFSNALTPKRITPFDYDKHFLKIYKKLIESELREQMAHNMTWNLLEKEIQRAIENQEDFCYETNFNSSPFHWPKIFKNSNYNIELIYFCLNSTEEAKRRVQIRVENGGHFVPENEILKRFKEGYGNLNKYFLKFNTTHLLDSSAYGKEPRHILSFKEGSIAVLSDFPNYLISLLPDIHKTIT